MDTQENRSSNCTQQTKSFFTEILQVTGTKQTGPNFWTTDIRKRSFNCYILLQ
jgi:hypothetical protein